MTGRRRKKKDGDFVQIFVVNSENHAKFYNDLHFNPIIFMANVKKRNR